MDTEHLLVQSSLCVNQHCGRGSLHGIRPHGAWKWVTVWAWQVDANRESNAVLMQKGTKRGQAHGLVVFEHRMQADDRHVWKELGDALSLRQSMRHTAWAEHLKGMHEDHVPTKSRQTEGIGGIHPGGGLPFGSWLEFH